MNRYVPYVCFLQVLPLQTPLWQSLWISQCRLSPQGLHGPPQSVSVSPLSFTKLEQPVGTQLAALQIWPGQLASLRQPTHSPVLVQTAPPFCWQGVPEGFAVLIGTPSAQVSSVHSRPSSRGSAMLALRTRPCPSHSSCWQSPTICEVVGVPAAASSDAAV